MGNSNALKIKKINEENLLRDIVFSNDKTITEYVYFITKFNKYFVENFRQNMTIKDFTLYNILTKKEYNIVIERVQSGHFLNGIDYSLESIPSFHKILFISNVDEDGNSKGVIKAQKTILLGNEMRYFSDFSDVEKEIQEYNAKFIFYDIEDEKIIISNYEQYRNKVDDTIKLGFECELRNLSEIDFDSSTSLRANLEDSYNEADIISKPEVEVKEIINESESEKIVFTVDEKENNIVDCSMTERNKPNILETEEEIDFYKKSDLFSLHALNMNNTPSLSNDFQKDVRVVKITETQVEIEDISTANNSNSSKEKLNKVSTHSETKSVLSFPQETKNKNCVKTHLLPNIHRKYNHHIPLFDQIDSNYNFLTLKRLSSYDTKLDKLSEKSDKSPSTTSKKTLLIKNYTLPTTIKISDIHIFTNKIPFSN